MFIIVVLARADRYVISHRLKDAVTDVDSPTYSVMVAERGADVAVHVRASRPRTWKSELQKIGDSILTTDEISSRMWFGRFAPQEGGEATIVSGTKLDPKDSVS